MTDTPIEEPQDGEYWVVVRLYDGVRAVAVATTIGLGMNWTLLDELAPDSDVVPVFRVDLQPEALMVGAWYAVVDPHTRKQSTAKLVAVRFGDKIAHGWQDGEGEVPVPEGARYPIRRTAGPS